MTATIWETALSRTDKLGKQRVCRSKGVSLKRIGPRSANSGQS
jgi:hypothetical protein